jgi:hypothetical protein
VAGLTLSRRLSGVGAWLEQSFAPAASDLRSVVAKGLAARPPGVSESDRNPKIADERSNVRITKAAANRHKHCEPRSRRKNHTLPCPLAGLYAQRMDAYEIVRGLDEWARQAMIDERVGVPPDAKLEIRPSSSSTVADAHTTGFNLDFTFASSEPDDAINAVAPRLRRALQKDATLGGCFPAGTVELAEVRPLDDSNKAGGARRDATRTRNPAAVLRLAHAPGSRDRALRWAMHTEQRVVHQTSAAVTPIGAHW